MKANVTQLLQKQMDRKDFLKHLGIGFAALTGIAAVVKTINSMAGSNSSITGYGASVYGGDPRRATQQKTS